MPLLRIVPVVALLAGVVPDALSAQEAAAEADRVFRDLVAGEPTAGAAVAVVVDGEVVWRAEAGLADRESDRPVTAGTLFRVGSVSKVVTGLALLRLVDDGRARLDMDVRELVPAVAHNPEAITLGQLAGHLGGIRHYRSAAEYLNTRRYDDPADAFDVFAGDPLVAPPGTRYTYSSYGYNVLGAAIAALTGEDYPQAARDLVLAPLGADGMRPEAEAPRQLMASPYSLEGDSLVPSPAFDPSDRVPSGGWTGSATDVAKLGYGAIDPGFLSGASRARLLEAQRTADGEETGYSIGFRLGRDAEGRRILHHGGRSVGARAFLLVYPDLGITVAVVANGPAEFAEEAVARIAAPFLAERD